ncbi:MULTISPECIES: SDR family NAD(P)-dependent oxidoreductase [Eubacterium]|uniref:3-oxoacyl-[acyl-carrier protein] reductase n=1 Tax=Eubacterium barkeri TaxID=1528 RepID=A0A1H3I103_EUBBA|nr:3-oxoacyl-ACP reductase family protein [Eubacterium barkeri]SDY21373.1 3-oxoacyl-[acyl-carrier protein] reductase [Eubacterium barkeri]
MQLKDKVAIITGASRGIGYAIAQAYIEEGAKVALCGSRIASAEKAAGALKKVYPEADILPIGVDISDTESVDAMVKATMAHYGKIDILVNNAGVTSTKQIFDMTDDDFESVLRINLVGPFKCIRAVAKEMVGRGGAIINTSSMVGTYGGKMQTAYSSSKFGVNGLTKSCAKELGPYNIRVNAVAPGAVLTDMVAEFVDDATMAAIKGFTPLGRMADPKELAGAYVYLASEQASFTTGTIIHVDGGIVM